MKSKLVKQLEGGRKGDHSELRLRLLMGALKDSLAGDAQAAVSDDEAAGSKAAQVESDPAELHDELA